MWYELAVARDGSTHIYGSLFDLIKCGFWSGEAIPGVRTSRPVAIRVRTAYCIAAT